MAQTLEVDLHPRPGSFTPRADEPVTSIPMYERDTPALRDKLFAHLLRAEGITVKFILEQGEDVIIRADKFFAVRIRHAPQVAEDPTFISNSQS